MKEQQPQVFIITGMGRSGTSLVAQFLQSMGIHMGDRLPEADEHNKYGYFEDLDFIYFHERILARHGFDYFANPQQPLTLIPEEIAAARDLIRAKSIRPCWGWKDPRTAFVLEFWRSELPQARFIFLYRNPVEVFFSQLKSHEWTDDPVTIIDAWVAYNNHILTFYAQYPHQSILCNIHGLLQNIPAFEALMQKKCGVSATIARKLYDAESLHHLELPQPVVRFLTARLPKLMMLYENLQKTADIPYVPSTADAAGDVTPLLDYACTVLHAVLTQQARDHQALQKNYQELRATCNQMQAQHDAFIRDLTASETYRLAQKIQRSRIIRWMHRLRNRQRGIPA